MDGDRWTESVYLVPINLVHSGYHDDVTTLNWYGAMFHADVINHRTITTGVFVHQLRAIIVDCRMVITGILAAIVQIDVAILVSSNGDFSEYHIIFLVLRQ